MAVSPIQPVDRFRTSTPVAKTIEVPHTQNQQTTVSASEFFEQSPQIVLKSGQSFKIPVGSSAAERGTFNKLLGSLTSSDCRLLMECSATLVRQISEQVTIQSDTPTGLARAVSNLEINTQQAVEQSLSILGLHPNEHGQAVSTVMAIGIGEVEASLYELATKIRKRNSQATDTRASITELRELIEENQWPEIFEYAEISFDANGDVTITSKTITLNNQTEAQSLSDKLESGLVSLRELTETDQFDLQQMVQEQQRIINIFSALLENIHKTQQSMANNLKA